MENNFLSDTFDYESRNIGSGSTNKFSEMIHLEFMGDTFYLYKVENGILSNTIPKFHFGEIEVDKITVPRAYHRVDLAEEFSELKNEVDALKEKIKALENK